MSTGPTTPRESSSELVPGHRVRSLFQCEASDRVEVLNSVDIFHIKRLVRIQVKDAPIRLWDVIPGRVVSAIAAEYTGVLPVREGASKQLLKVVCPSLAAFLAHPLITGDQLQHYAELEWHSSNGPELVKPAPLITKVGKADLITLVILRAAGRNWRYVADVVNLRNYVSCYRSQRQLDKYFVGYAVEYLGSSTQLESPEFTHHALRPSAFNLLEEKWWLDVIQRNRRFQACLRHADRTPWAEEVTRALEESNRAILVTIPEEEEQALRESGSGAEDSADDANRKVPTPQQLLRDMAAAFVHGTEAGLHIPLPNVAPEANDAEKSAPEPSSSTSGPFAPESAPHDPQMQQQLLQPEMPSGGPGNGQPQSNPWTPVRPTALHAIQVHQPLPHGTAQVVLPNQWHGQPWTPAFPASSYPGLPSMHQIPVPPHLLHQPGSLMLLPQGQAHQQATQFQPPLTEQSTNWPNNWTAAPALAETQPTIISAPVIVPPVGVPSPNRTEDASPSEPSCSGSSTEGSKSPLPSESPTGSVADGASRRTSKLPEQPSRSAASETAPTLEQLEAEIQPFSPASNKSNELDDVASSSDQVTTSGALAEDAPRDRPVKSGESSPASRLTLFSDEDEPRKSHSPPTKECDAILSSSSEGEISFSCQNEERAELTGDDTDSQASNGEEAHTDAGPPAEINVIEVTTRKRGRPRKRKASSEDCVKIERAPKLRPILARKCSPRIPRPNVIVLTEEDFQAASTSQKDESPGQEPREKK